MWIGSDRIAYADDAVALFLSLFGYFEITDTVITIIIMYMKSLGHHTAVMQSLQSKQSLLY